MIRRLFVILTVLVSLISTDLHAESKSLKKAMLFSIFLPGAGQRYLGNNKRANAMMAAEAGVWVAFYGFRLQGRMREERYKQIAEVFGGISGEKTDDYYRLMSLYLSSYDYNVDVLSVARALYPDDRQKQLEYFWSNGYFGDHGWEWDSAEHMADFKRVRFLSREAYRRSVLVTGFSVLNRIISALDVYLWFRLNQAEGGRSISIRAESPEPGRFLLYLSKPLP